MTALGTKINTANLSFDADGTTAQGCQLAVDGDTFVRYSYNGSTGYKQIVYGNRSGTYVLATIPQDGHVVTIANPYLIVDGTDIWMVNEYYSRTLVQIRHWTISGSTLTAQYYGEYGGANTIIDSFIQTVSGNFILATHEYNSNAVHFTVIQPDGTQNTLNETFGATNNNTMRSYMIQSPADNKIWFFGINDGSVNFYKALTESENAVTTTLSATNFIPTDSTPYWLTTEISWLRAVYDGSKLYLGYTTQDTSNFVDYLEHNQGKGTLAFISIATNGTVTKEFMAPDYIDRLSPFGIDYYAGQLWLSYQPVGFTDIENNTIVVTPLTTGSPITIGTITPTTRQNYDLTNNNRCCRGANGIYVFKDDDGYYYIYSTFQAPTVTTSTVTSISFATGTGGANVTDDGDSTITERGVCVAESANPTTADTKFTATGTTGVFVVAMTGLTAETTYHLRGYATNVVGTSYSDDIEFTTTIENGIVYLFQVGCSGDIISIKIQTIKIF